MDSKRRACLSLHVLIEVLRTQGTKTLVPEYLLQTISRIAETDKPELVVPSAERWRFWNQLTTQELPALIDEYRSSGLLDEERGARSALDHKTSSH